MHAAATAPPPQTFSWIYGGRFTVQGKVAKRMEEGKAAKKGTKERKERERGREGGRKSAPQNKFLVNIYRL